MSTPTVGLVGSRVIDEGLQNLSRKTVTDFTFPQSSRTPLEIGMPAEGTPSYKGPKTGDSYSDGVEDTQLCVRPPRARAPLPRMLRPEPLPTTALPPRPGAG